MNRTMQRSGDHTDSHTYAYDAAGRLVKETVSYDGGEAVDVQKLSYNAIGTLSGNDLGVFNEEYTYNVRGAMTKRKSAVFEQNISFAGKYNGSISSIKDNITGGLALTGYYTYDKAGRLTQASMTVGGAPRYIDYTYDLNSNITTLVRDGDDGIDPIAWIDNMTYEYDGNKVRKITDANGDVISERTMDFPDLVDLDVEYTYDRNGNMTGDANKGLEMSRDYNNSLYKVEDDEMTMTFIRTGSGQKLGKSVYVGPKPKYPLRPGLFRSPIWGTGGTFIPVDTVVEAGTTVSTDYFGAYEYVNGKFARLNTATGYRDGEGTHVYVRDWQGNIRAVVRKGDDGSTVLEQATYYYPYGMPMAESTNPTANSYKYTGKELLTDKGFNCYDFGPRPYDPATCIWLRRDDLSHETPDFSHNAFCNGDPINFMDPSGLQPVYNTDGDFLGCTSEGFVGDILIYNGGFDIDFSQFTAKELQETYAGIYNYNDVLQGNGKAPSMSDDAHSNLLTNFARHFEGTQIYDETFSLETIKDHIIKFDRSIPGYWGTYGSTSEIIFTGRTDYEATVENFAATLLVHEWYTHAMKKDGEGNRRHRLAYKNVMNYYPFWKNTTRRYKEFVYIGLQHFSSKEVQLGFPNPHGRQVYLNNFFKIKQY